MKRITCHSLIIAIAGACILSCSGPANQSTATYDIGLVEAKKITLPILIKKQNVPRTSILFQSLIQ